MRLLREASGHSRKIFWLKEWQPWYCTCHYIIEYIQVLILRSIYLFWLFWPFWTRPTKEDQSKRWKSLSRYKLIGENHLLLALLKNLRQDFWLILSFLHKSTSLNSSMLSILEKYTILLLFQNLVQQLSQQLFSFYFRY